MDTARQATAATRKDGHSKTGDRSNPERWTQQDRRLIDLARQLTAEEQQLILDLLAMLDTVEPGRRQAMQAYMLQQADKYRLRTAEGRAAFVEAMQAAC